MTPRHPLAVGLGGLAVVAAVGIAATSAIAAPLPMPRVIPAAPLVAMTPPAAPATLRAATVTAARVVVGAEGTDVVLTVAGAATVRDFTLDAPYRIVVDVVGAQLQAQAPSHAPAMESGVRAIRLGQFSTDVVRLVVEFDEPTRYQVVQEGGEVRLAIAVPRRAVAPVARQEQKRIRITFADRDIYDVIATFAEFSGRTFVIGRAVEGRVRFTEIIDQPWDIALTKILQANGLQAIEDSTGIITIDSYKQLADRVAGEPLVTQLVTLNYAKASQLAATIRQLIAACSSGSVSGEDALGTEGASGVGTRAITNAGQTNCGRGVVTFEEKTNTLLITETMSRLPEIVSYVRDLDVRTPQVAIKAKIIAVDRTATEEMGLSYDLGSPSSYSNALVPRGTPGEFTIDLGGDAFVGIANANRTFGRSAALSLIYNTILRGNNVTAFLDALSAEQLSDVQAEPSTTTMDNRKATLFAGSEVAFLLTPPAIPGQIQAIAPVIQRQKVGITLAVTPRVTANRQVAMEIFASQQTPLGTTIAGPEFSERSATNEVLVADGETAVIGGLTQTQVTRVQTGIPILMKIPYLGALFRQSSVIERKQDLLILVTPHIVDDGDVARTARP